jgi:CheY-like chemotaxis protein
LVSPQSKGDRSASRFHAATIFLVTIVPLHSFLLLILRTLRRRWTCGAAETPSFLMKTKILIVDDEAAVRKAIALILGKSGYSVETANSGEEALDMCRAKRYDLVSTDMRMAGMTGQQLAKRLKLKDAGQKIILVTAFPPADSLKLFDAVVLKPFSVGDLRARVSAALPENDTVVSGGAKAARNHDRR